MMYNLLFLILLSAGHGQQPKSPSKSVDNSSRKQKQCFYECVRWDDDGKCVQENLVCK